jgi:hypothetical protein
VARHKKAADQRRRLSKSVFLILEHLETFRHEDDVAGFKIERFITRAVEDFFQV